MATLYWKSGSSGSANDQTKWNTAEDGNGSDQLPANGDTVIFKQGGNCTWDLAIALASRQILTGYTGVITNSVDYSYGTSVQEAGTYTPVDTKVETLTGASYSHTGGTLTTNKLRLTVTYDGASVSLNTTNSILDLVVQATNVTLTYGGSGGMVIGRKFHSDPGKVVIIGDGKALSWTGYGTGATWENYGTIISGGNNAATCVELRIKNGSYNLRLGDIRVLTKIYTLSNTTDSGTAVLTDIVAIKGKLNVFSSHATYICTLDTASLPIDCAGVLIGTRGSLVQRNSVIRNSENWDSSAGGYDPGTGQVVQTGNGKSVKLAADQKFYDLLCYAPPTLASNITVDNIFGHVGDAIKGAYTLTLTHPELEYTGLRRPLLRKLVKRTISNPAARPLLEDLERT